MASNKVPQYPTTEDSSIDLIVLIGIEKGNAGSVIFKFIALD